MVSFLIPTLGEREEELGRLFNSLNNQKDNDFEVVIVSQGNYDKVDSLLERCRFKYKHVFSEEKGLSVARNIGIDNISGDILVLSDDDAWYNDDSVELIKKEFEFENSEILCFQIFDPIKNELYKNYKKHKMKVNKFQIIKKSSIEICVRISQVDRTLLKFDEMFGLGAKFVSGEENIFLMNFLKAGNSIRYVDKIIVNHRKRESFVMDKKYLESKTNLFRKLYGRIFSLLVMNLFLIKHRNKRNENFVASEKIIIKELIN